jgi:hypothetical protein
MEMEGRCLPSFLAPRAFDAGTYPNSVAVGDFNGDGIADLAVADSGDPFTGGSGVSVLLGNGDGSFQAPRTFAAGNTPKSVAVGDFNGDGKIDLAVANSLSDSVSVLLGNGDGTFQPARTFAAGNTPNSVAVGDFNGDGTLDLAVVDEGDYLGRSQGVSVLLGNGDGTFQAPRTFSAGPFPASVAVGDFNGDGNLDLAVTNAFASTGTVSVLLGNGDGTFHAARTFPTGSNPQSVVVGDFNGDGVPDLAVADKGIQSYVDSGVSVLLGNGDGSFQAPRIFPAGSDPQSLAVGDFNGDGIPDLAVANEGMPPYYPDGSVSVLLGNGDGSFRAARTFTSGARPESVAVGDFNEDGHLDLAVANFTSSNVSVLLGNGDGSFPAAPSYAARPNPDSVAVGDFNGDGILDLAVADYGNQFGGGVVSVLLGNGDGSFQAARTFAAGLGPRSLAVGDFNGDGLLDLAVVGYGLQCYFGCYGVDETVRVLLGNGDGTFQPARSFPVAGGPNSVAVGDFNGDGTPDLAVANASSNSVSVLLGNGDGSFQAARTFAAGNHPFSVTVGDFNGDGTPDLAVANASSNNVSVFLGNGDGTFQAARNFAAGSMPESVAVGDFNGDGITDLAVANNVVPNGRVSVLLGNGDGTFQAARSFAAGSGPISVAVEDFNGDGIPDLAVADNLGGVKVLLGNGNGTFQTTPVSYITGNGPLSVAAADLNGDGRPDLAVANPGSNDVSILLNDGVWTGAYAGPGRTSGSRGSSGRGAGVATRPALPHPAPVTEAPLAKAALGNLRPPVPAGPVADPVPVLAARETAQPASPAAASALAGPDLIPTLTRGRPTALGPRPILDFNFADPLATEFPEPGSPA